MLTRYERFTAAVFGIGRSIHRIEGEEMKRHGLKGSHAPFLVVLYKNPAGVTAAQLCEVCAKDKAAVSRALTEMEKKGVIKRESEVNYRARLTLTSKGKEIAAVVCRRVEEVVSLAEKELPLEQRQLLYTSLDHIAEELGAIKIENLK